MYMNMVDIWDEKLLTINNLYQKRRQNILDFKSAHINIKAKLMLQHRQILSGLKVPIQSNYV